MCGCSHSWRGGFWLEAWGGAALCTCLHASQHILVASRLRSHGFGRTASVERNFRHVHKGCPPQAPFPFLIFVAGRLRSPAGGFGRLQVASVTRAPAPRGARAWAGALQAPAPGQEPSSVCSVHCRPWATQRAGSGGGVVGGWGQRDCVKGPCAGIVAALHPHFRQVCALGTALVRPILGVQGL